MSKAIGYSVNSVRVVAYFAKYFSCSSRHQGYIYTLEHLLGNVFQLSAVGNDFNGDTSNFSPKISFLDSSRVFTEVHFSVCNGTAIFVDDARFPKQNQLQVVHRLQCLQFSSRGEHLKNGSAEALPDR